MFDIMIHEEAQDEIGSLPLGLRVRIIKLIQRLEQDGLELRMPHSRVISGGLFELRVGGKDIARCIYAFAIGRKIYVLHAFVKKTAKTPASSISIARKRLQEIQDGQVVFAKRA